MNLRLASLALLLSAAAPLAGGCKSATASGSGGAPAPSALTAAYGAWQANDFAGAFARSKAVADNMGYPEQTRQEAAYLAGKAGRKIGRRAEAVTLLGQAAESSDKTLRGQALAERGMVQNELERFKDGATSLLAATDLLTGEERALAYFHAGICEQKLNDWTNARIHLINAMRYTADAGLKADIQAQINVTGYTLQVGSFINLDNARRVCAQWKAKTQAMRLADPRVIQSKNAAGMEVFLVQVGQFSTFASARQRQGLLGANGGVVVPLRGN